MLIKVIAMHDDDVRYLAQGLGYKQNIYMLERRCEKEVPTWVYLLTSNKQLNNPSWLSLQELTYTRDSRG